MLFWLGKGQRLKLNAQTPLNVLSFVLRFVPVVVQKANTFSKLHKIQNLPQKSPVELPNPEWSVATKDASSTTADQKSISPLTSDTTPNKSTLKKIFG
jgi:hypothetical protein